MLVGCSELNARRAAREGNELYHAGNYAEAAAAYERSEQLHGDIPEVLFNHGLACRQLMLTGRDAKAKSDAADCALEAFERLKALKPDDDRPARLQIQTLFDAERYEELASLYSNRQQQNPDDLEAVNALIQVYSRWDRWDEALNWSIRRAELRPEDAQAAYSVGVFIYDRLFAKGGAGDATRYDPRPDIEQSVLPPVFREDDIVDRPRIELADTGIEFLKKAVERQPQFDNAMVYLNLLYRQRALGSLEEPELWQRDVEAAEKWRREAQALAKKAAAQHDAAKSHASPEKGEGG